MPYTSVHIYSIIRVLHTNAQSSVLQSNPQERLHMWIYQTEIEIWLYLNILQAWNRKVYRVLCRCWIYWWTGSIRWWSCEKIHNSRYTWSSKTLEWRTICNNRNYLFQGFPSNVSRIIKTMQQWIYYPKWYPPTFLYVIT